MGKNIAKIVVFILILELFTHNAFAFQSEIPPLKSVGEIPKTVKHIPFADSQNTSQYAPWMHIYHMQNKAQRELGIIGGESCQQIRSIGISPHDSNFALLGTDTNGLWKSVDGGNYWYNVGGDDYLYLSIQDIKFHPTDSDTVYIVSGSNFGYSQNKATNYDGVYRSRDRGENWELILHTMYSAEFFDKLIDFDLAGNLYVVSGGGVFKSSDDGTNWEQLLELDENETHGGARSIAVSDSGQEIFAGYSRCTDDFEKLGMHYSLDGGITWHVSSPETGMGCDTINFDPLNPDRLICTFFAEDKEKAGIYATSDFGKTWELIAKTPANILKAKFGPIRENGTCRYYFSMVETEYPFRYSDDYGINLTIPQFDRTFWRKKNETGWYTQGFDISKDGNVVMYAMGMGCQKSVDCGENFVYSNSGNSGLNINNIMFDSENNMYLSCVDVGMFYSDGPYDKSNRPTFHGVTPNGSSLVNSVIAVDPDDKNHILSFCYTTWEKPEFQSRIFSYDRKENFAEPLSEKLPKQIMIEYDNENHDIVYSNDATSFDHGKTWVNNEYPIAAISPIDQNVFYRYTGTGASTEVFISKDKGKTWTSMGMPGVSPRELYKNFYPDVVDVDTVWIMGEGALVKMKLGEGVIGTYNSSTGAVIDGETYWSFAQNPDNPKHLMLGQTGSSNVKNPGLIESVDGGVTWHVIPGVPGHRVPFFIKFSPVSDEVFVCTMTGLLIYDYTEYWKFLDSKITVKYNEDEIAFNEMPQINDGIVFLPARDVLELIGASVKWNGKTNSISILRKSTVVECSIGSDRYTMRGKEYPLDARLFLYNEKTFIPITFLHDAFDIDVGWDTDEKQVLIRNN